MSDDEELRVAWVGVCGSGVAAGSALDGLVARHREPHRRYHGVHHVVWVLRHVRALSEALPVGERPPDPAAVLAAALFHDAVYDPRAHDNEEVSAELAERTLRELGWPPERAATAAALVRATEHHRAAGPDRAAAVLIDADLAVLGSDPAAYQAYATGVRVEYAHVSDGDWRTGRSAVLRQLAERDPLYLTAPGRAWWQSRARANLAAELATLAAERG